MVSLNQLKTALTGQHKETMLNIDGKHEVAHILSDMIAREYAFYCFWSDGTRLKVAHRKGTWVLARFKDEVVLIDRLIATDAPHYETDNKLLLGLMSALDKSEPLLLGDEGGRRRMGNVLTKVVGIWAGPVQEIKKIRVLQGGRNSWVDEEGQFSFSPSSAV